MAKAFENSGATKYMYSGNGVYNHGVGLYGNRNYNCRSQNFSKGYNANVKAGGASK